MITHFAGLQLNTVSVQGVKQFYQGQLGMPILLETDNEIQFQPTDDCVLIFKESTEPLAPAHFAFEVPFSEFDNVVRWLEKQGITMLKWLDGRVVDEFGTGKNVYFRDGDGNLLEVIAHAYVNEGILTPRGSLKILYLREVGLPVDRVIHFRETLVGILEMKLEKVSDDFTFAIGGTAHCVIPSTTRKWIPISMTALPPKLRVSLGVSNSTYMDQIMQNLDERHIAYSRHEAGKLVFELNGYPFCMIQTRFSEDLPKRLNLPCSRGS